MRQGSARIEALDVLRAVALFGIIVTHAGMAFLAGRPPTVGFNVFSPLDASVAEIVRVFANGKFFSIFSFLFGVSFAIQFDRSVNRAGSFTVRFAWRLLLLLAIGFVHNLFFSGDILVVYAVLGFVLLAIRGLGTKVLLALGLVLIFNVPRIVAGIQEANAPTPSIQEQQAMDAARDQIMVEARRQFQIKQSGTIAQVVEMNFKESFGAKLAFQIATGRLYITFGCFLLGVCAWRAKLFVDSPENRRFMGRVLAWAVVPAIATTIIVWLNPTSMRFDPTNMWPYIALCVQQVALPAFLVAALLLAYWRAGPESGWRALAPMGKLGLTTYLTQTAFGLLVFYGFGLGLLGRIGLALCVALGIAFFVVQIFVAQWWLRRFSQGPVEWLWRSATDWTLHPLVREPVRAA